MYCTKFKLLAGTIILTSLTACSMLPNEVGGKWRTAYLGIEGYFFGYEDYPISRSMVDNIPYASLKMKIGKGPAGLLILKEEKNNKYVWASADGGFFYVTSGRIVQTQGLVNNLDNYFISNDDTNLINLIDKESLPKTSYRTISLTNPEVKSLRIKVITSYKGKQEIDILGKKVKTILIEEKVSNDYIQWNHTNLFWVDPNTGYVWKSIQQIAPNLPPIEIQVLKKPA